jgi:hypothetical protein
LRSADIHHTSDLGYDGGVESLWVLKREQVDPRQFTCGRVGSYLLGPTIRSTVLGEVMVALHSSYDHVVELERYAALRDTVLAGPDCALMTDVAHASGLRHRHIAPIVGAGVENGAPYVVRPHRLGRTLGEVAARAPIDPELSGAILHAVAEGIAWLAEQGPARGSCSMGGFDEADIYLGFDGEVQLVGVGTKLARSPGRDPIEADVEALLELLERLKVRGIPTVDSAEEAAIELRRAYRATCGERSSRIGALLRSRFEEDIQRERALFGLALLH